MECIRQVLFCLEYILDLGEVIPPIHRVCVGYSQWHSSLSLRFCDGRSYRSVGDGWNQRGEEFTLTTPREFIYPTAASVGFLRCRSLPQSCFRLLDCRVHVNHFVEYLGKRTLATGDVCWSLSCPSWYLGSFRFLLKSGRGQRHARSWFSLSKGYFRILFQYLPCLFNDGEEE